MGVGGSGEEEEGERKGEGSGEEVRSVRKEREGDDRR